MASAQAHLMEMLEKGEEGVVAVDPDFTSPSGTWRNLSLPQGLRSNPWNLVMRNTSDGRITLETQASLAASPLDPSWNWNHPVALQKYA